MPIHVKVVSRRTTPVGDGEEEDGRQGRREAKVWTLDDLVERGEKVYAANCAACHQANGKGAGPIKPLDGSPWCWMPTQASRCRRAEWPEQRRDARRGSS